MHVALGWIDQGRRVQAGPVVHCALEGLSGFEAQAEVCKQRHLDGNTAPVPFQLMPAPLNFVADNPGLISSICMQMPDGERPAVVCLEYTQPELRRSKAEDEAITGNRCRSSCGIASCRAAPCTRASHFTDRCGRVPKDGGGEIVTSIRMILRTAIAALKRASPKGYLPPIVSRGRAWNRLPQPEQISQRDQVGRNCRQPLRSYPTWTRRHAASAEVRPAGGNYVGRYAAAHSFLAKDSRNRNDLWSESTHSETGAAQSVTTLPKMPRRRIAVLG